MMAASSPELPPETPSLGFLALGECLLEFTPAGSGLYQLGYGGDALAAAWYARRLLGADWNVAFGSCTGQDQVSEDMLDFMAEAGLDTAHVRQLAGSTTGLRLRQGSGPELRQTEWRAGAAVRALGDDMDWLTGLTAAADVVYFTGTTLAVLPPRGRARLCDALWTARSTGKIVAFGARSHPGLWEDDRVMRESTGRGAAVSDIVMASFAAEAWLHGDKSPTVAVERYRAAGARLVAVTDGPRPVQMWSSETAHLSLAPPPVAEPVDMAGAGDAFAAGLLAALLDGEPPARAAAQGNALASLVIQGPGSLVQVHPSEVGAPAA